METIPGYECLNCGWCGLRQSAYIIACEPYCPIASCRDMLEPVELCSKCADAVAGDEGVCDDCGGRIKVA
jgi:hypothetical protein